VSLLTLDESLAHAARSPHNICMTAPRPSTLLVVACVMVLGCSKKKSEEKSAAKVGDEGSSAGDSEKRRVRTLPMPRRFGSDRTDPPQQADELADRLERRRERTARRDEDPERQERRRVRRAEMMDVYDKDGDGVLGEEERAEMRTMRVDERMTTLDKDGDGLISREEAEASGDRGRGGLRGFDRTDADGDGQLSREELENRPRRNRGRSRNGREEGP